MKNNDNKVQLSAENAIKLWWIDKINIDTFQVLLVDNLVKMSNKIKNDFDDNVLF